jgi:hypothetical protein
MEVKEFLGEYEVILSNDFPIGFPLMMSISHQIDLILVQVLLNNAPHRMTPIESEEINR